VIFISSGLLAHSVQLCWNATVISRRLREGEIENGWERRHIKKDDRRRADFLFKPPPIA
jgi:hypothetical protein